MTGWWDGARCSSAPFVSGVSLSLFSLVAEFKRRLRTARFGASRLDDDGFSHGRGGGALVCREKSLCQFTSVPWRRNMAGDTCGLPTTPSMAVTEPTFSYLSLFCFQEFGNCQVLVNLGVARGSYGYRDVSTSR